MSKYKSRVNILSTKEIGNMNKVVIDVITKSNVSIVYPNWVNSNPSNVVLIKGTFIDISINKLQWDTVLVPVINQVKEYLGVYPVKGQDIYLSNVKIGETSFTEKSIGKLFYSDSVLLVDLVKSLLEQKNVEQGF